MAIHKLFSFKLSIVLLLLNSIAISESFPEAARVTHLPGFNGTFPSKHYSGYVKLDRGVNLFYYFIVSEKNPSKDPVVLWLNGGPGCSSFDGFIYEHGPFNFEEGKKKGQIPTLHINPYSWSKVSSIIYLDSPAGVGFSYTKNSSLYKIGDLQVAIDTHNFLLQWLKQFSEFIPNPFYISGESYAGVYIPTLAAEIVKGLRSSAQPVINLKGYIIGNGVTDEKIDGNALVPFAHGMALISNELYEETKAACKGSYWDYGGQNKTCEKMLDKVDDRLRALNMFNILEPCFHEPETKKEERRANKSGGLPLSFEKLGQTDKPLAVRKRMFGRAWPFRAPVKEGIVPSWPHLMENLQVPCMGWLEGEANEDDDEIASSWLNNAEVRKSIHASPVKEIGAWKLCSNKLHYSHDAGSMLTYHKNLTMQGFRALIYSGDHDMCVPFTGTEVWTASLGYKTIIPWQSWYSNQQVAGYLQAYEHNLTFLTVKGAGHTVPEYKPRESLDFYSRWLEGKPI